MLQTQASSATKESMTNSAQEGERRKNSPRSKISRNFLGRGRRYGWGRSTSGRENSVCPGIKIEMAQHLAGPIA